MAIWYPRRWRWFWRVVSFASLSPSSQGRSHHGDKPLANAVEGKDVHDFEAFFWKFEPQIVAYLRRMTGDEQVAFDLSQETFLRAWQHMATIHQETARPWLYRVATNLALRYLQRRAAHPSLPLDEDLLETADVIMQVSEQDHVARTLQYLTPRQRAALLLHEMQGLSCNEVGQLLGMSSAAVRIALWRAREQFRIHYLHEGDGS